ncbi:hypothetical protein ACJX0J_025340, partial [Zea mays]
MLRDRYIFPSASLGHYAYGAPLFLVVALSTILGVHLGRVKSKGHGELVNVLGGKRHTISLGGDYLKRISSDLARSDSGIEVFTFRGWRSQPEWGFHIGHKPSHIELGESTVEPADLDYMKALWWNIVPN